MIKDYLEIGQIVGTQDVYKRQRYNRPEHGRQDRLDKDCRSFYAHGDVRTHDTRGRQEQALRIRRDVYKRQSSSSSKKVRRIAVFVYAVRLLCAGLPVAGLVMKITCVRF